MQRSIAAAALAGLKVGFVGLGNMGAAMATNLIAAGMDVVVNDVNPDHTAKLASRGATVAASPAALASERGMRAIITMLPSSEIVWSVYTGEQGLLSAESPRCPLFIDCSTISPAVTKELAARVQGGNSACEVPVGRSDVPGAHTAVLAESESPLRPSMGAQFVDAPVSGGVLAASKGTLTFMCGGSSEAVERARGVLSHIGSSVIHTGPSGAGQAAKVCNNLVLAVSMAAVAEGLALGQSLGLDPATLSAVFNQSSARCWSSEVYNPAPGVVAGVPASRDYEGGFSNRLMCKDVRLALEAAEGRGLPLGSVAGDLYKQASVLAGEDKDFSSVFKVYQQLRGGR